MGAQAQGFGRDLIPLSRAKQERLELLQEIARGGVGVIFRARDRELGREFAVKVLHEGYRSDRASMLRLVEEAQLIRQLQHPGIASILDVGCFADGTPYFAMQLVEGRTLSQLLAERLSPHERRLQILDCFLKISQTIAYAHSRRVVHRDLRPANVLVGGFGEVQVADWGVARALEGSDGAGAPDSGGDGSRGSDVPATSSERDSFETFVGAVLGAPSYLSPEQARGASRSLDERSDVFGLGAILCEILTGAPPYLPGPAEETLRHARDADLAPALARIDVSGFDRELVSLTRRCLSADPTQRPRHAGIVADEVSAYLTSVEERARSSHLAAASARARARSERKSKRVMVALTAVSLLVILGGLGGMIWLREREQSRSTRATLALSLAIEEAERARLEGRQAHVEDLTAWSKALEALARAEATPRDDLDDPALLVRLDALKESLMADVDRARKAGEEARRARELVEALSKTHEEGGTGPGWLAGSSLYAQVLRTHDIEIESTSVEAASEAIRATGIAPTIALALDHLALAKRSIQPELADEWRRLIEIARRSDPDPVRDSIRHALANDDFDALAGLSRSAELSESGLDTREVLDACLLLVLAGRSHVSGLDSSLRSVLASLHETPRNGHAWERAATLFGAAGGALEAIEALRLAVAASPSDPKLREQLSLALIGWGLMAEASGELEAATRLDPGNERYWLLLAEARDGLGELAAAVSAAEKAVRTRPNQANGLLELGRLLKDSGRFEEAIPMIERGIGLGRVEPGWSHAEAERWLAEARDLIELDRRFDEFRRGATRPADNRERARVALLFHQRRHYAGAARLFAEAFEWDASLVPASFLVAARTAARAAHGEGVDSREAMDDERFRFVELALAWISTGVEASDRINKDPAQRPGFARDLRRILGDVSFAPLQSPATLGCVPSARVEEISAFWKRLKSRAQAP